MRAAARRLNKNSMQVIPAINVDDDGEAERLFTKAAKFLPHGGWVHIDVRDGVYAPRLSGGSVAAYGAWFMAHGLSAEAHLMAEDYEDRLAPWFEAGAERIIVQVELVRDVEYLVELQKKYNAEIMISFAPDITMDEIKPYVAIVNQFQILAVKPGLSGQPFDERALEKIQFVRAAVPHAIIEVDGGITVSVARRVKKAGADIVVSSSYIWNSMNPQQAYHELCNI